MKKNKKIHDSSALRAVDPSRKLISLEPLWCYLWQGGGGAILKPRRGRHRQSASEREGDNAISLYIHLKKSLGQNLALTVLLCSKLLGSSHPYDGR